MTATSDKLEPAIDWPMRRRFAMVAMGWLPLAQIGFIVGCAWLVARQCVGCGFLCGFAMLYLFPPLMHRLVSLAFPIRTGRHAVTSPEFLRWWLCAQWQVIFNRIPILEELLRLVPGLYSMWLRLWGARIGSMVFWTPGLAVLDRSMLRIGSRVVFGAGVRINPHLIVPAGKRPAQLWLEMVTLGDDCLIGGYSLLTAGASVPDGQVVPAGKYVRPFSTWQEPVAAFPISQENPL